MNDEFEDSMNQQKNPASIREAHFRALGKLLNILFVLRPRRLAYIRSGVHARWKLG